MNARLSGALRWAEDIDINQDPSPGQLSAAQKKYGIVPEEYLRLSREQKGLCKICNGRDVDGKTRRARILCVDHCHKTGRVRGLLCHRCNSAIGLFRENPEFMRAGAAYIEGED